MARHGQTTLPRSGGGRARRRGHAIRVRRPGAARAGGAAPAGPPPPRPAWSKKNAFKLKYAPHIGMFANAAGKDPLDELRFMADQGFTAFEDNSMMRRTPELQQQMGDLMAKLGIAMGVFVIQTGGNNSANFTSGKPEDAGNFVKACTAAVDVAKRCNAKWMTVVPGNYDRRLPTRHADGARRRHAARRRRRPGEGEPGDGAGAAGRLAGPVPPLRVAGLHDLPRRQQPGVQDPVRHVPHAAQRGAHRPQHRSDVERRSATSRSATTRAARSRAPAR